MIKSIIEKINKEYNDIIVDYEVKEYPERMDIIIKLNGHYDYDDEILNDIKNKANAYSYYLSIKNNRLYITLLVSNKKYDKLKNVADKLYYAASYLSDNPNSAESLRKAMKEYYNFINDIK